MKIRIRDELQFFVAFARAFAGALLFSLPMLMTMEMWQLGFTIRAHRLAILMLLHLPLLTGLALYSGFETRITLLGAAVDAFVAFAVGFVSSAIILFLFGVLDSSDSMSELLGKIILQSTAGAFGAMLATSQLGIREETHQQDARDQRTRSASTAYFWELFLMVVGGLFFAFNVAPTEEITLIAHQMDGTKLILLALLSIGTLHSFVYSLEFRGQEAIPQEQSRRTVFLQFSLTGYALSLLVSFYCLWTFGHFDGYGIAAILPECVVLSFPTSLGAAAARLIL